MKAKKTNKKAKKQKKSGAKKKEVSFEERFPISNEDLYFNPKLGCVEKIQFDISGINQSGLRTAITGTIAYTDIDEVVETLDKLKMELVR